MNKQKRDKIIAQALSEIQFSRLYKQGRIATWQKNENLYYGNKNAVTNPADARANVELGKTQGFVHTILSKIDAPLTFKYQKGEEGDLAAVRRLNSLKEKDQNAGDWDMKDLLGKKQAVLYGRAIYCYHAESPEGKYRSVLENVDVYDFLIDPSGGGIDLERAMYMGRYGVVKTKEQLKEGRKEGTYIANEVDLLLEGSSNNTEVTQETVNESNRYMNFANTRQRELQNDDKYKFWEWYTTFAEDGKRYYLLLQETAGRAIRIECLEDIFEDNSYPFWSWAAFPDLTEFWTPSYVDYVREVFMAQSISINQMLDNAEQVNKPQKAINVDRIKNTAEAKYKKDGIIKVTGDTNVNDAIQILAVPSINTPIEVYNVLEDIQQNESGVTAGSYGNSDEDKVGIYEGNQANTADRFGLLNKSYAFGYKRFARLYLQGVLMHLTKPVAVQIIGPDGIRVEEIKSKDVKPYRTAYDILVESSNAETQGDMIEKRNRLTFLDKYLGNPGVNQKALFEMQAEIIGLTQDEIKRLQDVDNYGNAELMAEAARTIQRLIQGEDVPPNPAANNAFKQKIVDYMRENMEYLKPKQWMALQEYIVSIEPFIMPNMVRQLTEKVAETGNLTTEEGLNPALTAEPTTQPEAVI